jgi:hypothetical protein
MELAERRAAPRTTDSPARLDVFPLRRPALRHLESAGLWPSRCGVVRRLRGSAPAAAAWPAYACGDEYRSNDGAGVPLFFEPPSLDDRIVNQSAVFSIMTDPEASLADWLAEHPELYRKVVFPAELKWAIRNHLDQANVTERVLLPGLDGLCRWLARYYGDRPEQVYPDAQISPTEPAEPESSSERIQ